MIGIEKMKMPTCCGECIFMDDNGDYPSCVALDLARGYTFPITEKRFPECPLIEIEKKDEPQYCICSNFERGDTIYTYGEDDVGLVFERTRNIQFCPLCGKKLRSY